MNMKKCPRCASQFTCREDRIDLCQCSRIYLEPKAKDYIRDNFNNCLCPDCLKEISLNFSGFGVNPKYKVAKKL